MMALHPESQLISAAEGQGIRGLLYRIAQEASLGDETCTVLIPFERGLLVKMLHERCQVIREQYAENGLVATVRASERMVLKRLISIDKVAYVRFASVYRDFKDVDEFSEELRSLNQ